MKFLPKIRDFNRFVRTLSFRKTINLLMVYAGIMLSRIFRKPFVFGMPHTLSVEPTTRCNLACPECPVGNNTLKRDRGDMAFDRFGEILNNHVSFLLHLILYFQGEPFLAPRFFDMIKRAKQYGFYVSTSTNGHFLTDENISGLLDSGLDRLIVSLDGATPESYAKYRQNGDFHKVVSGVKKLMLERKRGRLHYPLVILQCLLFAHNADEKENVVRLGKELGVDSVKFKTAQFYNTDPGNRMIPKQPGASRYILKEGKYELRGKLNNFCYRIWTTAVVTWDGKLLPCCFDKNAGHPMGFLKYERLSDSWKSSEFMKFRKKVLKERKNIDICNNCTEGIGK